MSIYSNVTEQDLDILRKLSEQRKNERALKIKNKILKQTHDIKLAESFSPITKKLQDVNESISESVKKSTKQLVKKSDIVDENTQTPAIEVITGTQSLRDTLTLMKSEIFFKLQDDPDGKIFWNKIPIIALGEKRVSIEGIEIDIKPNIQNYFTNTRLTSKRMDN